jgi:hypothetical protein
MLAEHSPKSVHLTLALAIRLWRELGNDPTPEMLEFAKLPDPYKPGYRHSEFVKFALGRPGAVRTGRGDMACPALRNSNDNLNMTPGSRGAPDPVCCVFSNGSRPRMLAAQRKPAIVGASSVPA